MVTRSNKISNFWSNTSGSLAINFAVASTALVLAIGAAVDYNLLSSEKSKLQDWADSTALAAAVSSGIEKADFQNFAENFMQSSPFPEAGVDTSVNNGNLVVGLKQEKELVIMNMLGLGAQQLYAEAEVPLPRALQDEHDNNDQSNKKSYNVALILDTTSSMHKLDGEESRRLDVLKQAATWYLTEMDEKGSEDTMVSLVPFSNYVRIPTSYANESWIEVPTVSTETGILAYSTGSWEGCMNSRRDGYNTKPDFEGRRLQAFWEGSRCGAEYNNEMMPLTKNFAAAKTAVNSWEHDGSTYIPSGLIWGWRTLSPNAPFTEAAANPDAEKVAILITDGNNTIQADTEKAHSNGIYHDATGGFANIQTNSNAVTKEICDGMKADGIKIFTITFKVSQEETQDLLLECASEPGFFYRADDNTALVNAVEGIEGTLNEEEEKEVRLIR